MAATVAVDFDGVIHRYSRGWQGGEIYDPPVDSAFNALSFLISKYAVCIFTTRNPHQVGVWLKEKGGFYCTIDPGPVLEFWNSRDSILVTNRKLPAVAYIDDRAIRFTSWEQALAELASYERRPGDATQS